MMKKRGKHKCLQVLGLLWASMILVWVIAIAMKKGRTLSMSRKIPTEISSMERSIPQSNKSDPVTIQCSPDMLKALEVLPPAPSDIEDLRRRLTESCDEMIEPAANALLKAGLRAVVVDCASKFAIFCHNLVVSAHRVGLQGMVIVADKKSVCDDIAPLLQDLDFCLVKDKMEQISREQIESKGVCGKASPYHLASHGKLVSVMLHRSFVWWRFLRKGVGLIALDGDMAFKKNPLDFIDEKRFMLEVAWVDNWKPKYTSKGCMGGWPVKLKNVVGEVTCTTFPPPYFATPDAAWWFERHTQLGVMCQSDIQNAYSLDLVKFYPNMRTWLNETQDQPKRPPRAAREAAQNHGASNFLEYHGDPDRSQVHVPPQCEGTPLGVRFMQMGLLVSRCSHWHVVTEDERSYMVLAHASCVGGSAPNEEERIRRKIWWLNNTGVWYLPHVSLDNLKLTS